MDVYDEVDRRENDSGQFTHLIIDKLVNVFWIIPEFRILRRLSMESQPQNTEPGSLEACPCKVKFPTVFLMIYLPN